MKTAVRANLFAFARLVRLPNLCTVPGDIVCGFFLAGISDVALIPFLIAASMCLYCSGMVANDLFDIAEDRQHNLSRPLVRGDISIGSAKKFLAALMAAALVLCALSGTAPVIIGAAICLLIWLYTAYARQLPPAGFLAMGLLRGMNILLGASPGLPGGPALYLAVIFHALYVITLSAIAHGERLSPARQKFATGMIRGLIPLQVLYLALAGFYVQAAAIACLFPCMLFMKRNFYVT